MSRWALLLALVIAGGLFGCGDDGDFCSHMIEHRFDGVGTQAECDAWLADMPTDCSNPDAVRSCVAGAQDRDAYGACEDICTPR